jgi:hypothetical protein
VTPRAAWTALLGGLQGRMSTWPWISFGSHRPYCKPYPGPPRGRPKPPPRPNVWAPVEEGGTIYATPPAERAAYRDPPTPAPPVPVKPALRVEVTGLDEMRDRIEALLAQLDELGARVAESEEVA